MRKFTFCLKIVFASLFAVLTISCSGNKTALIWTDRPEFAIYGELFNNSQSQYKVSVRHFEFPAAELRISNSNPDIIVASWLKNSSTGTIFKSIDNLFGANKLSRSVFYPRLLAIGRIENRQFLLPVSFNIPAMVFSTGREQNFSSQFTIDFEEIKNLSGSYNVLSQGAYTQMGFSPLWNSDFLFQTAVLFGTSFTEDSPLVWDEAALERAMDFIYSWTHEINSNNQAEEDFTFKYFFEPISKLIQSGRILFSYMESGELFTLSEDIKANMDFRWLMEQETIPITEDMVYIGTPKRGKSQKAAAAFIQWFFQPDSQRLIIEYSKANRITESVFGICGGFSALSPVTEQIFPRYYPDLLGRMPPSEFLAPPSIVPSNWTGIKERVILPYLDERARSLNANNLYSLERRISDWSRQNR